LEFLHGNVYDRGIMNEGQRQVIAEKVSSTVRVLELLGFHDYEVSAPKQKKKRGNVSPRVIYVNVGQTRPLRIYNSADGWTWANAPNGKPIPEIKSVEDLYAYLSTLRSS
jgi:hypothetical protein